MSGLYIYGIMRAAEVAKCELNSLFPGRPFLVVLKDGVGAVAATTDQERFEATEGALIHHFEVLSKLMQVGTVFPIRFGTVARTEEEVGRLLTSLAGLMDSALERLAGNVEVDVEARWNPQVAYSQIAQADPEITAFKERLVSQGGQPTMEDRLNLGKLVAEAVTRHAEACRHKITAALCEVALESAPLAVKREQELFMNMAFFIEGARIAAFEQKLNELATTFEDAVHFKYAGPLPPYSFTGCEIMAVTPSMLDEARQMLELGETFTKEQFVGQYRKLSLRWHPDRQPGNPEAAARFKKLSASAQLLERFFAQYGEEFVNSRLPETVFLVAKALGRQGHLEWV